MARKIRYSFSVPGTNNLAFYETETTKEKIESIFIPKENVFLEQNDSTKNSTTTIALNRIVEDVKDPEKDSAFLSEFPLLYYRHNLFIICCSQPLLVSI